MRPLRKVPKTHYGARLLGDVHFLQIIHGDLCSFILPFGNSLQASANHFGECATRPSEPVPIRYSQEALGCRRSSWGLGLADLGSRSIEPRSRLRQLQGQKENGMKRMKVTAVTLLVTLFLMAPVALAEVSSGQLLQLFGSELRLGRAGIAFRDAFIKNSRCCGVSEFLKGARLLK